MKSQSFWLVKKNKPKILINDINYKKNNKSVLVKTLYSGISKGTERLVADGKVHKSQFSIMRCPFQEGDFNFPIKYATRGLFISMWAVLFAYLANSYLIYN